MIVGASIFSSGYGYVHGGESLRPPPPWVYANANTAGL